MMCRLLSTCLVLIAASPALAADAMTVKGLRAGGMYVTGEPATFVVTGATGQVEAKIVDFYHVTVLRTELKAEQGKPATLTVETAKLPRLGWHKLTVTSDAGSAETTFAVVRPVKDAVPIAESPFGAIIYSDVPVADCEGFAQSLKLAGVRWVILDIALAHLNPAEGKYVWTAPPGQTRTNNFDAVVRAVADQKIELLLKFLGQADWISKRTDKDVHAYWDQLVNLSPPSDPAKWTEVVTAVVERYAPLCDVWEIGNEPEGHGYFKGTDQEYMEYLRVTSKAVRAAQPKTTIVAASMYNGGGVLPLLVKNPDLYDIMSVHYLTGPIGDISPLERYTKALADANVKKVIWNTESRGAGGGRTPPANETTHLFGKGAERQSPTKAYARNFSMGIPRVFVFSWNVGEGGQIVNADRTPSWATVEYRTMTDQLGGAKFVRRAEPGKDLDGYVFTRDGKTVFVAWSDLASLKSDVKFTADGPITVCDIMGNPTEIKPRDGAVTVKLTYQPLFITGLAEDFQVRP